MTDLVVALFVAVLVFAGLYVPRWGDAIGRLVRRGEPPARDGAPPPPREDARPPRREQA
jgi:hypothetical protein